MRNYIPCSQHWKDMFSQYPFYKAKDKFSVKQIKHKELRNQLDMREVFNMLLNFNKEAWMPITLNKEYFLIDGQHRLVLAEQMGLEYIDVVVLDEKLLKL